MTAATSTMRSRLHRQRCRAGKVVFALELDEVAVVEMLIAGGLLPGWTDDRHVVAEALQRQIEILIAQHMQ